MRMKRLILVVSAAIAIISLVTFAGARRSAGVRSR